MKLAESVEKKPWLYSFDETFPQIEEAIKSARDELKTLQPPREVFTMRDYYPHNYSDPWDQACYVMRYLYAYSYEYFMIFSDIFWDDCKEQDLQILSLGCGVMPDAWAIQEAAKRMELTGEIEYTGVDLCRWSAEYVPKTSNRLKKIFVQSKAGAFLQSCSNRSFDIILFPKSIGDMYKNDRSDLYTIKQALGETIPLKDSFYMVFSFTDNEQENRKDVIEMDYLLQSIRNRGYKGQPIKNKYTKVGICNSYPPFPRLCDELVEDSRTFAKKHFMTSREHENYYICKLIKVK